MTLLPSGWYSRAEYGTTVCGPRPARVATAVCRPVRCAASGVSTTLTVPLCPTVTCAGGVGPDAAELLVQPARAAAAIMISSAALGLKRDTSVPLLANRVFRPVGRPRHLRDLRDFRLLPRLRHARRPGQVLVLFPGAGRAGPQADRREHERVQQRGRDQAREDH